MFKQITIAALLLSPVAIAAQSGVPAPAGVEVENVTVTPGQSITFTMSKGFNHQLLRIRKNQKKLGNNDMRVSLSGDAAASVLTVENGGNVTRNYQVMADYSGNGGFQSVTAQQVAANGSQTYQFDRSVTTVNVGYFRPGPQGKQ